MEDLQQACNNEASLKGTLLSACSAHDPSTAGQLRVIRFLVKNGVSVHETDRNGVTPLHRAVRFRSPHAVRELIKLGADVNAVDKRSGSTPLHRAVTNTGAPSTAGKREFAIEIATLLLKNGADPQINNRQAKSPIDYVEDAEMLDVFAAFVKSRKR